MTVGDTVGDPVEELVEQVRPQVVGARSLDHLCPDQICGVPELGRIVHAADIAVPQRATFDDAHQPVEIGIVIKPLLGDIGLEFLSDLVDHA